MQTITMIIADGLDALCDGRGADREHHQAMCLANVAPKMLDVLKRLKNQLPELDDVDAPLAGSEAVDALCSVWPDLNECLESIEKGELS